MEKRTENNIEKRDSNEFTYRKLAFHLQQLGSCA